MSQEKPRRSIFVVHWPGRSVHSCAEHTKALQAMSEIIGNPVVAITPIAPEVDVPCENCVFVIKRKGKVA